MKKQKNIYIKLTLSFSFGILVLIGFYAFYMYAIISNTVAADKNKKAIAQISSVVQELDAKYLSLSGQITPEMAEQYGLHEGKVSAYIERTRSLGTAQGFRNEI